MGGLSDIFLSPLYEFIEALAIMTAEQQDYQELNKK